MRATLVVLAVGAGAARAGDPGVEPSLADIQAAAARRAGGETAEDESRTLRVRRAHWAPVLRAMVGGRDDERTRRGELRLAPLREDDALHLTQWSVVLTWDFAQLVYAREESQLALAQAHLARLRREAGEKAARLYVDRQRAKRLLRSLGPGTQRADALLELLRLTAELDAATGGLFREALAAEEDACAREAREER